MSADSQLTARAGPIHVTRAMIARCRTLESLVELFERGGSTPVNALKAAKRVLEQREIRAWTPRPLKAIYKRKGKTP